MGLLFANHAKTAIVGVVTAEATEIETSPMFVNSFPSLQSPSDYFYASLIPPGHKSASEVVKVTAFDKTTGVMTAVRGLDDTVAQEHSEGTAVEIRIPAIALHEILQKAEEGIDGPRIEQFDFSTPSIVWVVYHNRNTTAFEETAWVLDDDGVFRKHLAMTEIVDSNSFKVTFTTAVSGYMNVRF